jgi:hypothetical protein
MMNGFGLMLDARNRNDALREVRKWVDKELGETTTSIKVEGNKTIVTLPDGRFGVSRCNPCDKFDIITGIRVALDDIERKSMKLNDEEIMCLKVAKKAGARYVRVDKYEASTNDIFMTYNKCTNEENVVLYLEDDNMFLSLDSDEFYDIDTLLKERG